MPTAALVLALLSASPRVDPYAGLELPPGLRALLTSGQWDSSPRGFRIVALSNLADACAEQGAREVGRRPAARACLARVVKLAEATRPRGLDIASASHGLWLTHFDLILGARDRLEADPEPALHEAISRALARASLSDPTRHAASYPGLPYRWPADESATLAALARFDRAHRARLLEAPLREWEKFVKERAFDEARGLPRSEATLKAPGARFPRGCAQSWMTRYLAEVDPALAREWWAAYRNGFLERGAGLVGFREYPRGVERAADADSGPILLGIGAAASALGISAARAMGDEKLARALEASADLVGALPGPGKVAKQDLSLAIRLQARWTSAAPDG